MELLASFPLHISSKYKIDPSEASNEMVEFLKSINAVNWEIEVFISGHGYKLLPHTDDCYLGDYAKINFAYSENNNHTMDWYEPIGEPEIVKPNYADKEGDAHYRYCLENVKHVKSETIKVALVNVGVPHGITTEKRRQCVSFIIDIDNNGNYEELTMSNCPENLKRVFYE